MAAADRTRRKQCGQCAKIRIFRLARGAFCLGCAAVWLWFGARTLCTARRILACQQLGSACFHAAHLWQSAERLQWR